MKGNPSVKDAIESLGVPHTEVDLIFAGRRSVDFNYHLQDEDKIKVYPVTARPRVKNVQHLSIRHLKKTRFVLDSHLGKLARHLRLLGFDSLYKKDFPDREIAEIAQRQGRVVLTRDIGLLKNKAVKYGYWVRGTDPNRQVQEILRRFALWEDIRPFRFCLECNGQIKKVAKKKISERLPPRVKEYYNAYYMCPQCRRVYWQGSHHRKLADFVQNIIKLKKASSDCQT